MSSKGKSNKKKINKDVKKEEENQKKEKKTNEDESPNKNIGKVFKNITPENISELIDYKASNLDDSEHKWKTYLYQGIKGELRKRLDEMIANSEYHDFFKALSYEYGFGVEKNLDKALAIYIKSAGPNSKDYLSITRLYDIYRNDYQKFKIKKDKNLEMVYLIKSFAYYSLSFHIHDSNIRFPLNPWSSVLMFLQTNFYKVEDIDEKFLLYIDELMKKEEYQKIITKRESVLIRGTIEALFWSYDIGEKNSYDALYALSYDNCNEATYKLVEIFLNKLNNIRKKEKENEKIIKKNAKKKENLITKINELFKQLEKNKYYPAYSEYGYFLYEEMKLFDKSLEIFKEGYEHNQYNCALYYFHSFTKSENQEIYRKNNFKANKFIEIFQTLIDSFIIGEVNSLDNIFDYFHIIGKKYNLFKELSSKYMNYLNEIAELCLLFIDKEKGEYNCKLYSPRGTEIVKYSAYKALGSIYMYGLTTKVKKHLIKAENCFNEVIKDDKFSKYSEPYYTRLLYKIKKKLFNLDVFEDETELNNLEKKVFDLYEKNKDYEHYGNSYYYYFGKLYENGIGTKKDLKMAYSYYLQGCKSLFNLFDSFVIVYKRFLSIEIINSNKFDFLKSDDKSKNKYNAIFRLSIGKDINLLIHDNMTIREIKKELYRKNELQGLKINVFIVGGETLKENELVKAYKIKDKVILVMVTDKSEILSTG